MLVCSRCNSSGFVVAKHKTQGGLYAFLCDCDIPRVRGLAKIIKPWRSAGDEFEADSYNGPSVQNAPISKPTAPSPSPAPQNVVRADFRKAQANDKDDDYEIDFNDLPF